MTDRELLELAAKAAGYVLGKHTQKDWAFTRGGVEWNPRIDSGQALELAVKLRKMPVIERWSDGHDWVFIPGHEGGALPLGTDPLAATRRAIVRAAAEIGRSKE